MIILWTCLVHLSYSLTTNSMPDQFHPSSANLICFDASRLCRMIPKKTEINNIGLVSKVRYSDYFSIELWWVGKSNFDLVVSPILHPIILVVIRCLFSRWSLTYCVFYRGQNISSCTHLTQVGLPIIELSSDLFYTPLTTSRMQFFNRRFCALCL